MGSAPPVEIRLLGFPRLLRRGKPVDGPRGRTLADLAVRTEQPYMLARLAASAPRLQKKG